MNKIEVYLSRERLLKEKREPDDSILELRSTRIGKLRRLLMSIIRR